MEKFNKSRAQEMQVAIKNLSHSIQRNQEQLEAMKAELKERCPHPDEFVVKLDEIRPNRQRLLSKSKELWLCKLCGKTQMKEG